MLQEHFDYINKDGVSTNIGPNAREILLQLAEEEFNRGNLENSIFHQIRLLYQSAQERYRPMHFKKDNSKSKTINVDELLAQMNADEKADLPNNALIQYALKTFKENPQEKVNSSDPCDIFRDISDPSDGVKQIQDICKQMPEEWTILQLCKGFNTLSTYSKYSKIHESDAAIYLTILRHIRTCDYPKPICLRFTGVGQKELFNKFACIVDRFKQCVEGNHKKWSTVEDKKHYWKLLGELNNFIALAVADLKSFLFPWSFLFTGIPNTVFTAGNNIYELWRNIDTFCDQYQWNDQSRVLLSLAALNAHSLINTQIEDVCTSLTDDSKQRAMAFDLLEQIREQQQLKTAVVDLPKNDDNRYFPCVLIVDERLDHFYWEEINICQEFTRASSFQSLWRLYYYYRKNIEHGYVKVSITDGACLINPDKNLSKMELRMSTFFDYWLPHWKKIVARKPTNEEFFKDLLARSCYVYTGHGSGLQYINGRNISKHVLRPVVFLFGCDSCRLHTNGLYSELIGAHLYYQAAMCPAIVGTIMPGLDANMDRVATEILSRWIAPNSANILPWNEVEMTSWIKKGIIEPAIHSPKCNKNSQSPSPGSSNMGSLCAVLARVHQRNGESKLYNTVPYVCRGLPVWNCHVEPLTFN
ncbi:separin-like [Glossina fuscipes]|uniref:separase n=1 Tax=Glossina fuscipes TaxID=7396 RepID=A0A9C6DPW9_9MUSC|nr:separin-like [Glossina fuscipes]